MSGKDASGDSPGCTAVAHAGQRLGEELAPWWVATELPWRRWRTPYRVFLAEFLLVRTRSDVVARLFEQITAQYPDLPALARAGEAELAVILRPLGLRKRVALLMRAAEHLVEHHEGQVPEEIETLLGIPGVGPYTAAAVAAFAYDSAQVPADVNVLRFLARLTGLPMKHPTKGSQELNALLPLLSPDAGGPSPETLLDFTRIICCSRNPRCTECPVNVECSHFAAMSSEESTGTSSTGEEANT